MNSYGEPHSESALAAVQQAAARALLRIRPDGWQTKARRNAWAAMVADRQRRAERAGVERDLREVFPAQGSRALIY